MKFEAWLPMWVLLSSLVTAFLIFLLPESWGRLRTTLNLTAATVKLGLVAIMFWGVDQDRIYQQRLPFVAGADLVLRADAFSLLFVGLSSVLWLATTVYAVGYLEGSPQRRRFFGFFSLCVASTMGIALAGNLLTFFVFYELLTVSTYPLVVHRGTTVALRAGDTYLRYTIAGGAALLLGIAILHGIAGGTGFEPRGLLAGVDASPATLTLLFVLLIGGLGVKAALLPLQGWLPVAMVAPAPVSALLHAVAVVKAGAFGITRVVYEVYGVRLAAELGLLRKLAILAALTILYGSVQALRQDDIKRRLAWSTISQLSYIALGVATFGPIATIGGILHIVHQGLMKITMFFCAGNLAEELDIHKVSELEGIGQRMPLTMAAFTLASFGMIGLPPVAGFVSKWYLGTGAIDAGQPWVVLVLVTSSLLNAAYFLPVVHAAWFREPRAEWAAPEGRLELRSSLLLPTLFAAALALGAGLVANTELGLLGWAHEIAELEYGE